MTLRAISFILLLTNSGLAFGQQTLQSIGGPYRLGVYVSQCGPLQDKPQIDVDVWLDEPFFAKVFVPSDKTSSPQESDCDSGRLFVAAGLLSRNKSGELQLVFTLLDWSDDRNNSMVNCPPQTPHRVEPGVPLSFGFFGGLGWCYTLVFREMDPSRAAVSQPDSLRVPAKAPN